MYGTVMVGRSSTSVDDLRTAIDEWRAEIGDAAGYVDQRVLVGDDGLTVMCVRFRDRASYEALADNPRQDAWWQEHIVPMLQGEPSWYDGDWHDI